MMLYGLLGIISGIVRGCKIASQQSLLAVTRLNVGQQIYSCEPCGGTQPKAIFISALSTETVDNSDFWHIEVKNREVDLAYIFVKTSPKGKAMNLSILAGYPAKDISPSLAV
jgi:hypothetical protein